MITLSEIAGCSGVWNCNRVFNFEWLSMAGLRHFEVIAYVTEGEIIIDNNNIS